MKRNHKSLLPPPLTYINRERHTPPFSLLFLLLAFLAACSDDKPEGGTDTPDDPDTPAQAITIPAGEDTAPVLEQAGGTATLTFTATDDWTAEVTAITRTLDWVSVQPASGQAGETTLTITTQPNDTYDERNAAIVLTCAGQQTTLTVTQKQQDALLVSSNKVELDATGGSFTLTVQANVAVSHAIEPGADWLTATQTRALTESTLAFEAAANDGTDPRQAVITLTGDGLTEQVTVYQAGTDPVLVLGQREYLVGSTGETIQVELQSNTDYEVQMPAADWLTEASTRALSAYTHYFTIAPNDTYDSRTAQIIFTNTEQGIADTLTVTQLQLDAIVLAQSEYTLPADEDTLSFPVQANVEVTATADVDWITPLPATRALQEQQLSFRIDALTDTTDRQGTITLTCGGATQQITVKQIYTEPKLVRVEYRTGYTWEEAHDNLPLLYYATVYRDRYYDNGEKFTDTFVDAGHMVELTVARRPNEPGTYTNSGITIVYGPQALEIANDSILTCTCSVQVPDPSLVVLSKVNDRLETQAGDWDAYHISKLYDNDDLISAADIPSNGNWENDDRQAGWYFTDCGQSRDTDMDYQGEATIPSFTRYSLLLNVYDQFLVIDGRRIDFLKYRPDYHFNLLTENIANGKVMTSECRFEFMGRNFYCAVIETITQQ